VAVAGELGPIAYEIAGGDRPAGAEPATDGLDRLERDVRNGKSGTGQLGGSCVEQPRLELDPVCPRILCGDLDGDLVDVERDHGCKAQPRRGDREHAGAAADVENGAPLLGEQELEAEAGRGMRAGAEGAAGVDHDGECAGRGRLPRRADPKRTDRDAVMELAPAVLPSLGDFGDERVGEGREHAAGRLSVRGELDGGGALALLESLGRELDEAGAELFRLGVGRRDGGPDQRNALLSLSKKP